MEYNRIIDKTGDNLTGLEIQACSEVIQAVRFQDMVETTMRLKEDRVYFTMHSDNFSDFSLVSETLTNCKIIAVYGVLQRTTIVFEIQNHPKNSHKSAWNI